MASVSEVLVQFLAGQHVRTEEGRSVRFFGGVFAIFGHGNVAGLGPALGRGPLWVLPAHNEQGMGMAAVAFAKAHRRRRALICTTSIGPGATNLLTPAAAAHISRLPALFLLGDAFADRGPDPVLQQLERDEDPSVTVNDCFRPVARYFDRIHRAEQLLPSLERAMQVLLDPVRTGPVFICLPQDVQVESLTLRPGRLAPRCWDIRRPAPDPRELEMARQRLARARRPVLVVGGGAVYSGAQEEIRRFMDAGMPAVTTHAGRDAVDPAHPGWLGGLGVTGSEAANRAVQRSDLTMVLGCRLTDFTTGSQRLLGGLPMVAVNVDPRDAMKNGAQPVVGDVRSVLESLSPPEPEPGWIAACQESARAWWQSLSAEPGSSGLTDAQVLDAVAQWASPQTTVVASSGGIPGELQKRWRGPPGVGTHVEYGFSAMGYELAGAVGVCLADPAREVVALVGDGAYLMLNGELATAVQRGLSLKAVVLDNRGYGCIHRLQQRTGGPSFSNLERHQVDLVGHARSLGAPAEGVQSLGALEAALDRARNAPGPYVVVVKTDPDAATQAGGFPWRVPGAEGSSP